jgi:glycosyltransferase involved in cell wall biosynthesis
MKISVIIPCYNGEKYIAQCLENVLCQSYKDLEIIIVNDGSKDNSAQIAEKYPVKIISQENQGLSVARNIGIDVATGDYIHFFDVDDYINLDFYKNMVDALELTNADIACAGMVNELKPHRTLLFAERILLKNVEDKMCVTHAGKYGYVWRYMFKKTFLVENNFKFKVGILIEDMPFSLPAIFYSNAVVTVPNATYYYKKRGNSIMTTQNKAHRKKRHEGVLAAREFKKNFAFEHNFIIPKRKNESIITKIKKLFM